MTWRDGHACDFASAPSCGAALLIVSTFACSLQPYVVQSTETSATGDETSSSTTTITSTSTSTSTSPTTTSSSGSTSTWGEVTTCGFICGGDHPPGWCDIWAEDCPEGQKCMPVSLDGDNAWETVRCVPLAPNPDGLYETCMLLGTGVDGLDTCGKHMVCLSGICTGICTGPPAQPTCVDADALCWPSGSPAQLCFPQCDPIAQDCDGGDVCTLDRLGPPGFKCFGDASGDEGQVFDPCEYACDPGLFCADPVAAIECDAMASGCCLPFCDIDEVNTCPGQGQECIPWYDNPADAASYNTDVGFCARP